MGDGGRGGRRRLPAMTQCWLTVVYVRLHFDSQTSESPAALWGDSSFRHNCFCPSLRSHQPFCNCQNLPPNAFPTTNNHGKLFANSPSAPYPWGCRHAAVADVLPAVVMLVVLHRPEVRKKAWIVTVPCVGRWMPVQSLTPCPTWRWCPFTVPPESRQRGPAG